MQMNLKNLLIIFIALLLFTLFAMSVFSEEQKRSFSYTRLYPDQNGVSHFTEARMEFYSWIPGMEIYYTLDLETKTVSINRFPPGYAIDWHKAPAKQFVIVLNGTMEIESGDGEKRLFSVGSVILVEDTVGQGHKTKSAGKNELVAAWIRIP